MRSRLICHALPLCRRSRQARHDLLDAGAGAAEDEDHLHDGAVVLERGGARRSHRGARCVLRGEGARFASLPPPLPLPLLPPRRVRWIDWAARVLAHAGSNCRRVVCRSPEHRRRQERAATRRETLSRASPRSDSLVSPLYPDRFLPSHTRSPRAASRGAMTAWHGTVGGAGGSIPSSRTGVLSLAGSLARPCSARHEHRAAQLLARRP